MKLYETTTYPCRAYGNSKSPPKDLINQTTNHIYIDKFVVPDIASSDIRAWLYSVEARQRQQARLSLPSQVYRYIVEHQLYAPDV